jgi:hypothetical protein
VAAGDARANVFADQAEQAFQRDQALTEIYHQNNNRKWDGMMLQTHIGYTYWQQPSNQIMPDVKRVLLKGEVKPIHFASSTENAERQNVIAIEAPNFSRVINGAGLTWHVIPNLGRTQGAVLALPQGHAATTQQDAVRLEYDVSIQRAGDLTVQLYLAPTLDTTGRGSLRIGVSVDDGPMLTLVDKLLPAPNATTLIEQRDWNTAVQDNVRVLQIIIPDIGTGKHVIKVWRLDDNVVLQKIVASTEPIPLSYLGPAAH